ncbi:MAG: TolC family protein [Oligoflexia bacterium]|nr:TolC family protein [Oligoflexia bacterium]
MRVVRVAALMILLSGPAGESLAGESLSWQACREETARSNAELQAARETLRASRASERGAYSGFFPQFSGSLGYSYGSASGGVPSLPGDSEASGSYSAGLSGTLPLFSGGKDRAAVAQAAAGRGISEASLEATRAKVSGDLKVAYAGLLYAQSSVKLQQEIARRRAENLRLVELRFESGRENKGSVLLSKAYLNQARYETLQARNGVGVYRAQLARVLGRDSEAAEAAELTVTDEVPLETLVASPAFATLALQTPAHREALGREQAAEAAVTLARAGFFPTLGLTASTTRNGDGWFPGNPRWSLGATLSWPFFSGGKDYYATGSALATRAAAAATRGDVDRQTLARLRQAHAAYGEASEKLKVDESFREAALKRAEIARGKYNNGLMSFEDWDLIENDLILRERAVLQSRRDRVAAEAAWLQVQGKGILP